MSEQDSHLPPPTGAPVDPTLAPPAGAPEPGNGSGAPAVLEPTNEWQRLSMRMLLVHPLRQVAAFIPVIIGILIVGRAGSDDPPIFVALGVIIPLVLGVVQCLTTRYQITDTHVEVQRGLLNRQHQRARLDRVRTVELTASPLHRLVGVQQLTIGTGAGDPVILDSLPSAQAQELRRGLLRRGATRASEAASGELGASERVDGLGVDGAEGGAQDVDAPTETIALGRWQWARFAPLTSGYLITGLVATGFLSQFFFRLEDGEKLENLAEKLPVDWVLAHPAVTAIVGLIFWVLLFAALAVVGYLLRNYNFRLSRGAQSSLHTKSGLLSTYDNSLDGTRVRGVSVEHPLLMRAAGGAQLRAITVDESEHGASRIFPPAPAATIDTIAEDVLRGGVNPAPAGLTVVPLRRHGKAATVRRYTRALWGALLLAVPVAIGLYLLTRQLGWSALALFVPLAVALVLAWDRSRQLGHASRDGWLVTSSGSLDAAREIVHSGSIIGWAWKQSPFQRRVGLGTLSAATAAAAGAFTVLDVNEGESVALANELTPGLLEPFLTNPAGATDPATTREGAR